MKMLTPRQKGVYDFLKEYVEDKGYAPSYREIQSHFSFSSLGSVHKYLKVLIEKGYIAAEKGRSRSLRMVEGPGIGQREREAQVEEMEVSFMGYFTVGNPIETFAQMRSLQLPYGIIPHPEHSYILQVKGEGLIQDHIMDGDLLVLEPGVEPVNGDVIVADTPSQKTVLRRYSADESGVCLTSLYEGDPPIHLHKSELTIFGTVVTMIRSLTPLHH